jgi:hypothetical protein
MSGVPPQGAGCVTVRCQVCQITLLSPHGIRCTVTRCRVCRQKIPAVPRHTGVSLAIRYKVCHEFYKLYSQVIFDSSRPRALPHPSQFAYYPTIQRNTTCDTDSSVKYTTKINHYGYYTYPSLWGGRQRNLISIPGRDRIVFCPLQRPDRLWGPPSPLSNCYKISNPGGRASWGVKFTVHLHLVWRHTSTPHTPLWHGA